MKRLIVIAWQLNDSRIDCMISMHVIRVLKGCTNNVKDNRMN